MGRYIIPKLALEGNDADCGDSICDGDWNRLSPMHLDPIKRRTCLFPLYGCLDDLGVVNIEKKGKQRRNQSVSPYL